MKKITTLILLVFLLFSSTGLLAQVDTLKNEYQKEFGKFLKSSQQEFHIFKTENDSVFYNFLEKNWQEFRLLETTRPTTPKPVKQPVMKRTKPSIIKIKPTKLKIIREDSDSQICYNSIYKTESKPKHLFNYLTINFYGAIIQIPKTVLEWNSNKNIGHNQIADFFKTYAENDSFLNIVKMLKSASDKRVLNGYGYLRLVQQAAFHYFTKTNDQVLFTWLALLKTGYDAKVGYNKQNIYLLVYFDTPVFYYSYFENHGKRYYLIPFASQDKLSQPIFSFPEDYPGSQHPVSLILNQNPKIPIDVKTRRLRYNNETVVLKFNQNLKAFYDAYPDCNLSLYFPPVLSKIALSSLADYLNPMLKGKSTIEKVNLLLDFIQKGFPYATDKKQFGKEKYMFAEETIGYPYSDCEDRAILLSHLIRFFTGLKSIGLVFPGHVSLAVLLPKNIIGTYVEYANERYYICDPTYIGSRLGMIMPEYAHVTPKIITFKNN